MSSRQRVSLRSAALITVLVLGVGSAVTVLALGGAALSPGDAVNTDKTGLALGGYDPVAYFDTGKPMKGDFQITAEHEGAVYRFVTEESRAKFRKNPNRYLPQYGGYCAYGVAVGKKFSADPTVWKIVDGKLYVNLDENIAKLFDEDIDGHIARAEENWKKIAEEPAR